MTLGYASAMAPGCWITFLVMLLTAAGSGRLLAAEHRDRSRFTIEVLGLSSADPIDRRMAEIVMAGLVEAGHVVVVAEDRDSLREAEADLALLASRDPEQAMDRLRTRTADWRLECGVQGAVGDAEVVYGLNTYSARFEVTVALVRTIDGRIESASPGVGVARSEAIESALDQALTEATSKAVESALERLRSADEAARTGEEFLFASSPESSAAIERLRGRLPAGHRLEMILGGVRVEPPLEASWHREIAPAIGWTTVDRAPGVRLMRIDAPAATVPPWAILVGVGAIATTVSWWFVRRRAAGVVR